MSSDRGPRRAPAAYERLVPVVLTALVVLIAVLLVVVLVVLVRS